MTFLFFSPIIAPLWAFPNFPVVTRCHAGPESRNSYAAK